MMHTRLTLLFLFLLATPGCGRVTLRAMDMDAGLVDAVPVESELDARSPDADAVSISPDAAVPDAAVPDAQCDHVLDLRRSDEILMPHTLTFPHGIVVGSNRLYRMSLGVGIFGGFAGDYIEGGTAPESMRFVFDTPVNHVMYTLTGGFVADGSVAHVYETDLGLIRTVYTDGDDTIQVEHDGVTWLEIRGKEGNSDGVRVGEVAYSTCSP